MTANPRVFYLCYKALDALAEIDRDSAAWSAHDWLLDSSAHAPVPLLDGLVRGEARIWAEAATPEQLHQYFEAIALRLRDNALSMHSQTIKRLIAVLYKSMTASERGGFKAWMEKQG